MNAILKYDLSNSQVLKYIEEYTKDERERNLLKDRIIKGALYEDLRCFYGYLSRNEYRKMKDVVYNFEKWLTREVGKDG